MLYEKMLTAVEETSTFGLEWDPHPVQLQREDYKDEGGSSSNTGLWFNLLADYIL